MQKPTSSPESNYEDEFKAVITSTYYEGQYKDQESKKDLVGIFIYNNIAKLQKD